MNRQEKRIWNRSTNKLVVSHAFSYFKKYWQFFLPITFLLILLYVIPLQIVEYELQKRIITYLVILEITFLVIFSEYSRQIAKWKKYLHNSDFIDLSPDHSNEIVSKDEEVLLLTQYTLQHLKAKNQLELDNKQKAMILKHLLQKDDVIKFTKLERKNAHLAMKILGILLIITGVPTMILLILFGFVQISGNYSDFLFVAKGIIFAVPPFIILLLIFILLGLKTYDINVNWIQFLLEKQFEDSIRLFQRYLNYPDDKSMDEITQFQVLEYAQNYIKIAYNSTDFDILR